ncbi:MAG: UbiA family prenyltransferase [Halolamina sp.]
MGGQLTGWSRARHVGTAVACVNRIPATVGYNVAYLALGLGLGASTAGAGGVDARVAAAYATAVMLTKMAASVADAIHDRDADAINPEKSVVAEAVETLGPARLWSLLVTELAVGMALFGSVAVRVDAVWPLAAGAALSVLGFWYSFPPRLKERGLVNHLTTTTVDVALFVVPVGVVAGDGVTASFLVVGAVVFCYTFAYHLVHQAADVHYDRRAEMTTFATRVGVDRTVAVAAVTTAAAGGFAVALGYPLGAVGTLAVTALYVRIYAAVVDASGSARSDAVARSFNIAWVATGLNLLMAVAVWRYAVGAALPSLPLPSALALPLLSP